MLHLVFFDLYLLTIMAHSIFQPSWLDHPREQESWNKSHANPPWFKHCSCLISSRRKGKWTHGNNGKSEAVVPTSLQRPFYVSHQSVAHGGWRSEPTEHGPTAGQWELDPVFITLMLGAHLTMVNRVFPRFQTFDLTILSLQSYCCCLLSLQRWSRGTMCIFVYKQ